MTKEQKQQWLFRVVLILAFIGLMIAYFKTEIAASNRQAIRKALRDIKNTEERQFNLKVMQGFRNGLHN